MAANPAAGSKVPATAKQPADHQPKGDIAADAKPAGWDLLKPFDQVPVWEQTDLIHIVTPLLDVKQGDELSFSDFDVRIVGQLAQKLQEYALDQEAYLTFVSGPGALQRAMELGVAYATQLGGIAALRGLLAEHPDIEYDLWDLYRLDIGQAFAGRLAVRHVFRFVERLQDEPWSRYRAKLLGGQDHWREHLGWGPAEYVAAAEIDAVQMNTVVTAYHGSRKRPKAPEPFYRPEGDRPAAAKSLDDVDTDALESMINR